MPPFNPSAPGVPRGPRAPPLPSAHLRTGNRSLLRKKRVMPKFLQVAIAAITKFVRHEFPPPFFRHEKKRGELKLENLQRTLYARSTHDQSHNSHARCARSDPPSVPLGPRECDLCSDDRPKPAHTPRHKFTSTSIWFGKLDGSFFCGSQSDSVESWLVAVS